MYRALLILLLISPSIYAQETQPIKLDLGSRLLRYSDLPPINPLEEITFNRLIHIPGVVKLEYVGLHNMVLSQMERRIKSQGRDNLYREFHLGNMTISEYNKRLEQMENVHNPYGEWWERPWYFSLPPEKGGAPKEQIIYRYGWELQIPQGCPFLKWCEKKFNAIGDVWIDSDRDIQIEDINRSRGTITPIVNEEGQLQNYDRLERIPDPNVGVSHNYRWYRGSNYHIRFKPSVRFRPFEDKKHFVDEVSLKTLIELYTEQNRHWADLVGYVRYDIPNRQTEILISFELGW